MPSTAQSPPLLTPVSSDDLGQLQLYLPTLKVLSYRGPGQTGGVSSSLEPVVKRLGTRVHWFAVEEESVPQEKGRSGSRRVPTLETPGFAYYTPKVPSIIYERHAQVAYEYLWPLLHGMPEKAVFDAENWKAFRALNEVVASDSLSVSSESFPTLCWLHDYHLPLVAPLMSMQAGLIICQFWHVPWPEPEAIVNSPVGKELVDALLCNRVIGFHTTEYATNFLNTVVELFPNAQVDMLKMEVRRRRNTTRVMVMPLGIDFSLWQRQARSSRPVAEAMAVKYRLANQIVLGVDRLDYTKGILEKLDGLELFLSNSPNLHRRFHYVQIAQPPQSQCESFARYEEAVKAKVKAVNDKFEVDGWQPIIYFGGHFTQQELAAWYQAADILVVNSLRDGLNLIAKEFVACRQDEQGVLVLSRRAGCAAELSAGALMVDADASQSIAQALTQALSMEVEEKRRRMTLMRRVVGWNQLHDWALGFLKHAIQGRAQADPRSFDFASLQ